MLKKEKYQLTKGLPKELREIADSAIDHVGRVLDNTGPRDIIYILAYFAAVELAYRTIKGLAKGIVSPLGIFSLFHWLILFGVKREPIVPQSEDIDYNILAMSMVVAYIVLKIDASDITSAVTRVSAAIAAA